MRLAHVADLHIGFRQFERLVPGGGNQREADVALALHRVVDDLLATRPDLVLIAGDVFHQVRPPNGAIRTLFAELGRLREGLPATRVVLVAGNHDTPRTSQTEFILPLYRALGIDVALLEVARVALPGVTVTAVPSDVAHPPLPAPDPAAALNVLLIHGDVPGFGAPTGDLEPEVFTPWDYVALGHYHVASQVGERAWYAGAIEFTSSDPWREARLHAATPAVPTKGYLLVELEPYQAPVVTFRPIALARPWLDLEPIDAQGLGAAEIDTAIAARVAGVADDAVARLVVTNVSRETQRTLDHVALRAAKSRLLHFQVRCERPEGEAITTAARLQRHRTLDQVVEGFLGDRELPPDVDRAALQQLGAAYMRQAAGLPDPYTGEPVALPAAS